MAAKEILLLGNPILRVKCPPVRVGDIPSGEIQQTVSDLHDTLADFRSRRGFGRGIAAPQIGVTRRVIYVDFEYTGALINPNIIRRSRQSFQLWDDCFSFPDILVRVNRNTRITVQFNDAQGKKKSLDAEGALSELLQHEIDHVNGILAIDRAIDSKHIILRSEFDKLSRKSSAVL